MFLSKILYALDLSTKKLKYGRPRPDNILTLCNKTTTSALLNPSPTMTPGIIC